MQIPRPGNVDRPTLAPRHPFADWQNADQDTGKLLQAIQERGYAVSDREVGAHHARAAAPVLTRSGLSLAAVAILANPLTTSLKQLEEQ